MTAPAITAARGGITAPAGFRAAGVACGLKPSGLDLALLVSDAVASAAGLFTTNLAVAAPVVVSREQLARSGGYARVDRRQQQVRQRLHRRRGHAGRARHGRRHGRTRSAARRNTR